MAGENEDMAMAEKKVPVFTVIKNNTILKNIYLVDTPPPPPSSFTASLPQIDPEEQVEETLVVGRHPDCSITLEHPSISRYHLRIHSKPSSHSLSVTDLWSVHGTWVSGKKIEPGVRIELNDGDTLQLGGSSRICRLHWAPLSRAYDLENPFVPPMDEESEPKDETEEGTLEDDLEGLDSLLSDMDINSSKEMNPSAAAMPDDARFSFCGEKGDQTALSEASELLLSSQPERKNISRMGAPTAAEESKTDPPTADSPQSPPVSSVQRSSLSIWSRRGKLASVQIQTDRGNRKSTSFNADSDLVVDVLDNCATESISKNLFPCVNKDAEHEGQEKEKGVLLTPDKDNCTPNTPDKENFIQSLTKFGQENMEDVLVVKSSVSSVDEDDGEIFIPNKENMTPRTLLLRSMKKMRKMEEIKPNKENGTPNSLLGSLKKFGQENTEDILIVKTSVSTVDENGDELFTPNKENMTPDTFLLRSMKKIGKLQEIKHFNPYRSSPLKNVVIEEDQTPEVLEENQNETWEVLQEKCTSPTTYGNEYKLVSQPTTQKGKPQWMPLQSLPVESTSPKAAKVKADAVLNDRKPDHLSQGKPVHNIIPLGQQNKGWTMIADTETLLNEETRKALQLLQGVKGTNLVIPRIVLMELDCMNRRGSFFKRANGASYALQWIEDCMVNTKWWIRVQSSVEEVKPTAPTPPTTPLSRSKDDNNSMFSAGSIPFSSPSRSCLEILSPTAQDHILECALLFRRITDGDLVLLSDNVSTKIKAMAEGLVCETAQQFRESLVNPFSKRFLWSDSSPRGPTWCCADDIVLKESYYNGSLKKPLKSAEVVKGLKLILLHNSSYRQKKNCLVPMN